MTTIKTAIEPDRLVPAVEEEKLKNRYHIGCWEYDERGVDCEEKSTYVYLYTKYWCTDYGEFKQNQQYSKIHEELCDLIGVAENPDHENVEELIEALELPKTFRSDQAFLDHMEEVYSVPNEIPPDEDLQEAADIWLRYLMERGPQYLDED